MSDQDIRFCTVRGRRVAYATVGHGPALVLPPLWIGHLELEWDFDRFRAFIAALARGRMVVRYDRLGTGLSDRDAAGAGGLDLELETVAAVAGALGLGAFSLLGVSWGGCTAAAFAARDPERVRAAVFVGAYAHGAAIASPAVQAAMAATVRAHWGAGSRLLADVWVPGASAEERDRFARFQRGSASAETAASMLEAVYAADVRGELPRVRAPALVLHRRRDRAMPFDAGRELAALVPGARLVALDGDAHPPYLGDSKAVVQAVAGFLADHDPVPAGAAPPEMAPPATDRPAAGETLSAREVEVLRLIAEGLADAAIAERLVVSPHTVHRHVANIRTKLGQPSRAAAAAYAARRGLI